MSERRSLPVLQEQASSIAGDGTRNWVQPADVVGTYTRVRRAVFFLLVMVLIVTPWIRIGGRPAIQLDIARRQFFFFGLTANAQDAWLLFFLITGMGFALFVVTTVWGRIWCGYACPQTVFLEGIYRRVERLIEGSRIQRMRRDKGPLTFDRAWRKVLKHVAFLVISLLISHAILVIFVSAPTLWQMIQSSPADNPTPFAWSTAITLLFYGNFAFFREQLCLIVCPYGRLQSVLTDRDSLVVGYDTGRGEPRGKAKDPDAGDCVDCKRCVVVCPTGIDIRNGLQIDCIGCAACIDACDEVMDKLKRPRGLVRYDSQRVLDGGKKQFWRWRLGLYAVLGLAGLIALTLALRSRTDFEANLLRLRGAPFSLVEGGVRNGYEVHVVNKRSERTTYLIEVRTPNVQSVIATPRVSLDILGTQRVPIFVTAPRGSPPRRIQVRVTPVGDEADARVVEAPFLAPGR